MSSLIVISPITSKKFLVLCFQMLFLIRIGIRKSQKIRDFALNRDRRDYKQEIPYVVFSNVVFDQDLDQDQDQKESKVQDFALNRGQRDYKQEIPYVVF